MKSIGESILSPRHSPECLHPARPSGMRTSGLGRTFGLRGSCTRRAGLQTVRRSTPSSLPSARLACLLRGHTCVPSVQTLGLRALRSGASAAPPEPASEAWREVHRSPQGGALLGWRSLQRGALLGWRSLQGGALLGRRSLQGGALLGWRSLQRGALLGWRSLQRGALLGRRSLQRGALLGWRSLQRGALGAPFTLEWGALGTPFTLEWGALGGDGTGRAAREHGWGRADSSGARLGKRGQLGSTAGEARTAREHGWGGADSSGARLGKRGQLGGTAGEVPAWSACGERLCLVCVWQEAGLGLPGCEERPCLVCLRGEASAWSACEERRRLGLLAGRGVGLVCLRGEASAWSACEERRRLGLLARSGPAGSACEKLERAREGSRGQWLLCPGLERIRTGRDGARESSGEAQRGLARARESSRGLARARERSSELERARGGARQVQSWLWAVALQGFHTL